MIFFYFRRGVAQLVAHTAGGREVAGSSPVSPTINNYLKYCYYLKSDELHPDLKEGIDYCHWVHFSELKNFVFRPYITSFISELILKPQDVLEFNQ